ncbi:hypothetical protein BZL30_3409 [Mycobacterium kansasii]|uniref:Uncharacterized protein n=1 Tax=Mycobacterium kansasii TaxID=1768 RepID=A0A1V3X9W5_MYCKA|nr:hypothetical protein BZL30_3409 [Mycobacterium kansasii]
MRLHRPFGRIPELLVDVDIDVFDDLTGGGIVAEFPQRAAHLLEPLLSVRKVPLRDGRDVSQFRPVPGQDGPLTQSAQPVQRFQVVGQAAVVLVQNGGAAAQHAVGGQDGILEQERQRVGGVTRVASTVIASPAASITSPSLSVTPSPRWNCGFAARTGAPVSSTSLSMPSVWSPWRWLISTSATRPSAAIRAMCSSSPGPGSTMTSSSLPGPHSTQVLVPSSVIRPGLSATSTDAVSVTGRNRPYAGWVSDSVTVA